MTAFLTKTMGTRLTIEDYNKFSERIKQDGVSASEWIFSALNEKYFNTGNKEETSIYSRGKKLMKTK